MGRNPAVAGDGESGFEEGAAVGEVEEGGEALGGHGAGVAAEESGGGLGGLAFAEVESERELHAVTVSGESLLGCAG